MESTTFWKASDNFRYKFGYLRSKCKMCNCSNHVFQRKMKHPKSQAKRDFGEKQTKFREDGSAKKNVATRNMEVLQPFFSM